MDRGELIAALEKIVPARLATDAVDEFLEIRRDVATGTLGRATPGKFVESLVQILQALESGGKFDSSPAVDRYLNGLESRQSSLPDGLRICAARIGRGMYSLRSKRSIAHKGEVDPTEYDLRFLYAGAQWVLTELLALTGDISGDEAARLIAQVQLPVGELVEAVGDRKIAYGQLTVREEALVLLMSWYPDPIDVQRLLDSMDRRAPNSVRNAVGALWKEKLLHREGDGRIVLTSPGLSEGIRVAGANGLS